MRALSDLLTDIYIRCGWPTAKVSGDTIAQAKIVQAYNSAVQECATKSMIFYRKPIRIKLPAPLAVTITFTSTNSVTLSTTPTPLFYRYGHLIGADGVRYQIEGIGSAGLVYVSPMCAASVAGAGTLECGGVWLGDGSSHGLPIDLGGHVITTWGLRNVRGFREVESTNRLRRNPSRAEFEELWEQAPGTPMYWEPADMGARVAPTPSDAITYLVGIQRLPLEYTTYGTGTDIVDFPPQLYGSLLDIVAYYFKLAGGDPDRGAQILKQEALDRITRSQAIMIGDQFDEADGLGIWGSR